MGAYATYRSIQAAERKLSREAQRRHRELERQAKEQAKLSELERARLEAETFQNKLDLLLSIHKQQGEVWDWSAVAASLPPVPPKKSSYHEFKAKQLAAVSQPGHQSAAQDAVTFGQKNDDEAFEAATRSFEIDLRTWQRLQPLATRVVLGEPKAYTQVLNEFNPFAEIHELGSALHFTIHTPRLLECSLKVNGKQAIPTEVKSVTANGKLSTKPMARGKFHEIYQDYVSSCMLRVAREVFALLPIEMLLLTASADVADSATGVTSEQPVFSASIPRQVMGTLNFEQLDPSDAMQTLQHRGSFQLTRKSETFAPITPFVVTDICASAQAEATIEDIVAAAQKVRSEIASLRKSLNQN